MLEIFDRTTHAPSPETTARTTGVGPPKEMPPIERYLRPQWPRRAKVATAALAVLAVAGAFGTAVQYFGDDTSDLEAQVEQLTEERDALTGNNEELTADLAAVNVELAATDLEMKAVESELQAAEARITEIVRSADELRQANDDLSAQLSDTQLDLAFVESSLERQVALTETVVADRDALAALFPVQVATSLEGVDIAGTYAMRVHVAYNSGLADIALPNVDEMTISRTSQGWLHVTIPGVIDADLTGTDGVLVTIVDNTTAVPAVNGAASMSQRTGGLRKPPSTDPRTPSRTGRSKC